MTMAASTPNPIHIFRKVCGVFCCGGSSIAAKLLVFAPEILPQIRFDCAGVDAGRRETGSGIPACGGAGLRQRRRPQDGDVLRIVRKPKRTGRIAYATTQKTKRRLRPKPSLHEFCVLHNIVAISLTPPS